MTSKRRKLEISSNNEILIQNTSKLTNACRKVLRDYLHDDTIQLNTRHESEKKFISIEGGKGSPVIDVTTNNRYWVVPIFPTEENNLFWIGFSLIFKKRIELDSHELLGASIRFYKGLATDSRKLPIFRAEWDIPKGDNKHEQPHWHIYPQEKYFLNDHPVAKDFLTLLKEDELSTGFLEVKQEAKDTTLKDLNLQDFHFAMASLWHNGKDEKVILKEDYLVPWLKGCLNYIKEQLVYISQ